MPETGNRPSGGIFAPDSPLTFVIAWDGVSASPQVNPYKLATALVAALPNCPVPHGPAATVSNGGKEDGSDVMVSGYVNLVDACAAALRALGLHPGGAEEDESLDLFDPPSSHEPPVPLLAYPDCSRCSNGLFVTLEDSRAQGKCAACGRPDEIPF